MVIFGAGASHDSISPRNRAQRLADSFMPPRASELFERRPDSFDEALLRHPTISAVMDRLRHIPAGRYVEEILEEIKSESATYPMNYRYIAAIQFYLRDILYKVGTAWQREEAAGVTNYSTLMGMLYEWQINHSNDPVVLVTFNYDRMLDEARIPFSGRPGQINDYIDTSDFPLLKPHGSVDWFVEVEDLPRGEGAAYYDPGTQFLTDSAPWSITDAYHVINNPEPDLFRGERWIAPVVAIPVQRKETDSFAFPRPHLDFLRKAIAQVTNLLILGWSGRENHFHDLWKETGARVEKIVAVAGDEASGGEVLDQLPVQAYWTNVTTKIPFDGGFSDFVADRGRIAKLFGG